MNELPIKSDLAKLQYINYQQEREAYLSSLEVRSSEPITATGKLEFDEEDDTYDIETHSITFDFDSANKLHGFIDKMVTLVFHYNVRIAVEIEDFCGVSLKKESNERVTATLDSIEIIN